MKTRSTLLEESSFMRTEYCFARRFQRVAKSMLAIATKGWK
jgi:hypothetical protein